MMSRIGMLRGRVSMYMTASAISAGSIRLPDALASRSMSCGQSAISAVNTARLKRDGPDHGGRAADPATLVFKDGRRSAGKRSDQRLRLSEAFACGRGDDLHEDFADTNGRAKAVGGQRRIVCHEGGQE